MSRGSAQTNKEKVDKHSSVDTLEPSSGKRDPLPETIWWKIAIVMTILSIIPFFAPTGSIGSIAGGIWVISWVTLPVALYEDAKITAETSAEWSPRKRLYGVGAVVPILATAVGLLYIGRRYNYNKQAAPNRTADEITDEKEISILRQRYAQGEIDEEEFERRLDDLLETETRK